MEDLFPGRARGLIHAKSDMTLRCEDGIKIIQKQSIKNDKYSQKTEGNNDGDTTKWPWPLTQKIINKKFTEKA